MNSSTNIYLNVGIDLAVTASCSNSDPDLCWIRLAPAGPPIHAAASALIFYTDVDQLDTLLNRIREAAIHMHLDKVHNA